MNYLVAIIIAGIIAGIIVYRFRAEMLTANEKKEAANYISANSVRITDRSDIFVRKTEHIVDSGSNGPGTGGPRPGGPGPRR